MLLQRTIIFSQLSTSAKAKRQGYQTWKDINLRREWIKGKYVCLVTLFARKLFQEGKKQLCTVEKRVTETYFFVFEMF